MCAADVVHLGTAWVQADVGLGPRGRTAEALGKMGVPILQGAFTTSLTASSLFLPRMVTFQTFGRSEQTFRTSALNWLISH